MSFSNLKLPEMNERVCPTCFMIVSVFSLWRADSHALRSKTPYKTGGPARMCASPRPRPARLHHPPPHNFCESSGGNVRRGPHCAERQSGSDRNRLNSLVEDDRFKAQTGTLNEKQ